jgi:hypothetical protein
MNYLERQRLREDMQALSTKRDAAIEKRKKEKHIEFLQKVAIGKAEQKQKSDLRAHIIEAERAEKMLFQLEERKYETKSSVNIVLSL